MIDKSILIDLNGKKLEIMYSDDLLKKIRTAYFIDEDVAVDDALIKHYIESELRAALTKIE